jgi:hypothetical protein
MKKKNIKEIKRGAIYLTEGQTLADVLKQLLEQGVTDFSKVKYDHDYIGCHGGHGDEYCYCPSSYGDMRFNWEA